MTVLVDSGHVPQKKLSLPQLPPQRFTFTSQAFGREPNALRVALAPGSFSTPGRRPEECFLEELTCGPQLEPRAPLEIELEVDSPRGMRGCFVRRALD